MNKFYKISLLISLLFLSGCVGTDMQKKLERFFAERDDCVYDMGSRRCVERKWRLSDDGLHARKHHFFRGAQTIRPLPRAIAFSGLR